MDLWRKRVIFIAVCGSHSIGTATNSSDIDIRGIFIPPDDSYLDGRERWKINPSLFELFESCGKEVATIENITGRKVENARVDIMMFDLGNFIRSAYGGVGIITDLLYVDPKFHIVTTQFSDLLFADKSMSLTLWKKIQHYAFALSWARRLRHYFDTCFERAEPSPPPAREDFGLLQRSSISRQDINAVMAALANRFEMWISRPHLVPECIRNESALSIILTAKSALVTCVFELQDGDGQHYELPPLKMSMERFQWNALARAALYDFDQEIVERFVREWHYKVACDTSRWSEKNFFRLLSNDYQNLRKDLMHIVRRLRISKEVLLGEKMQIYRHDADTLLDIKHGKWTFAQIFEEIERLNAEIGALFLADHFSGLKQESSRDRDLLINRLMGMARGIDNLRVRDEK